MLTLRIFCRQISSILSPSVNLAMNHLFSDLQSVKPILASLQNTEGVGKPSILGRNSRVQHGYSTKSVDEDGDEVNKRHHDHNRSRHRDGRRGMET